MLYLHDVWVNWFEGEENGYNVCPFHEWRRNDRIELLDQMPLLYIDNEFFKYIENDLLRLPEDFLQLIKKKAYLRKGTRRKALEYACITTNGKEILAIDTDGYESPIRKSRLIPRQEQIVFKLIHKERAKTFQIPIKNYKKNHHLLSLAPKYMYGLTRKERQLKQLLMMGLSQLIREDNIKALKYWLTEWNPKMYPKMKYMSLVEVKKELHHGLIKGWSYAHEEFGEKLIKNHTVLGKMWDLELNGHQDPSHLR